MFGVVGGEWNPGARVRLRHPPHEADGLPGVARRTVCVERQRLLGVQWLVPTRRVTSTDYRTNVFLIEVSVMSNCKIERMR